MKAKNKKVSSLEQLSLKKMIQLTSDFKKLQGNEFRLCPKCHSLDVERMSGDTELGPFYKCKKCGFYNVFFPVFSVSQLKKLAAKKKHQPKTKKTKATKKNRKIRTKKAKQKK